MSNKILSNKEALSVLSNSNAKNFGLYIDSASTDLINIISEIALNVHNIPVDVSEELLSQKQEQLSKVSRRDTLISTKRQLIKRNHFIIKILIRSTLLYLENSHNL